MATMENNMLTKTTMSNPHGTDHPSNFGCFKRDRTHLTWTKVNFIRQESQSHLPVHNICCDNGSSEIYKMIYFLPPNMEFPRWIHVSPLTHRRYYGKFPTQLDVALTLLKRAEGGAAKFLTPDSFLRSISLGS